MVEVAASYPQRVSLRWSGPNEPHTSQMPRAALHTVLCADMERISYIDEGDMDHEGSWNAITVVLMDVYWCTEWHAVCRGLQRQILAGFRDLLIKTLCFTRCSSKKT